MYVYIYIYRHTHTPINAHICRYIYIYIYIYTHTHIDIHISTHVCMCRHIYIINTAYPLYGHLPHLEASCHDVARCRRARKGGRAAFAGSRFEKGRFLGFIEA